MDGASANPRADLAQLREILDLVRDRFTHDPRIYWADLLASAGATWAGFLFVVTAERLTLLHAVVAVATAFAFFRAGSFIHEIQHIPAGKLVAFKVAWNALVGVPFFMPSTLYDNHGDHHNPRHYSTARDGEYLPLGRSLGTVAALCAPGAGGRTARGAALRRARAALLPASAPAPALLGAGVELRDQPELRARDPGRRTAKAMGAFLDLCGCASLWTLAALGLGGVIEPAVFVRLYAIATLAVALNWLRNLAAHSYTQHGRPISSLAQLRDSVTIEGSPFWTELFFPVGLRYHSLHHLLPAIPYHQLGGAHRTLMAKLPPDSPYRATVSPSLAAVLKTLLSNAAAGALRTGTLLRNSRLRQHRRATQQRPHTQFRSLSGNRVDRVSRIGCARRPRRAP